ncbi:6,7-dimethyl-8-ribityllumazine synthase [Verrucomicrobiaceae bacterium R5-34]|uniref:6,7-dimethyl-8-ribityllumazine synthase n=1 Tax=Oceaniferula flava TaxID=2800421 RepID=A0AAE2SBH2_9BACT|nr:6,7-dimethyl-8-ribityllumazine synthase [Oceaniferula flavus]MBK1829183.1 6,7-dimethyl-8-ribityllumazine synthase [Verrucomicrobiaceae bacterium R5-34]MBK1853420.1 6,7-dimethyl-8-ribityllumazine synthase [Oceaniferula flavus]MBM1134725.1 6,7-dimethyl-8-ribityllumazine synthase [Oceaniferula flavus]
MSKVLPPKPRSLTQKTQITIVASHYNEEFTDALVENTHEELLELIPNGQIELVRVPGAFEIPVAVETVLRQSKPECVICLGLIIRGQTAHGDMVAESVTQALQQISVNHATPVVHEVLLVGDEKQAYARCIGSKLNRGREAARAAAAIVDTFTQLKRSPSRVFPSNA